MDKLDINDVISRGFAINQHNGWIAILSKQCLNIYAPTKDSLSELKLTEQRQFVTGPARIRFNGDNIYIFNHCSIFHFELITFS